MLLNTETVFQFLALVMLLVVLVFLVLHTTQWSLRWEVMVTQSTMECLEQLQVKEEAELHLLQVKHNRSFLIKKYLITLKFR